MIASDRATLQVAARSMARMWEHAALSCGGRAARWTDAVAADPGAPNVVLNRTTLIDPGTSAEDLSDRIHAFYAGRGIPYGVVDAWDHVDLSAHGFHRFAEMPCMLLDRSAEARSAPENLRIVRVQDDDELLDFKRVLFEGFSLVTWPREPDALFGSDFYADPAHVFVGYADERAVGCSVSLVGDDAVGVYLVATLPEYRGRGIGEALSWAAATTVPTLPALLQASGMGKPVYERMGFRTIGTCAFWIAT